MGKVQYSIKNFLNEITGSLATAVAVANGVDIQTAGVLGAGIKGIVGGFELSNETDSLKQRLSAKSRNCFSDALIDAMKEFGFELPEDAEKAILDACIPEDVYITAVSADDADARLEKVLLASLRDIEACDSSTVPIKNIACVIAERLKECIENDEKLIVWAINQKMIALDKTAKRNNEMLKSITYYFINRIEDANVKECQSDPEIEDIVMNDYVPTDHASVFISGKMTKELEAQTIEAVKSIGATAANSLSRTIYHSFAGEAAVLIASGYEQEQLRQYADSAATDCPFIFHYLKRPGQRTVRPRMGIALYHRKGLQEMRNTVLPCCSAILCLGNGVRCREEINYCNGLFMPIIPVAFTGDYAHMLWNKGSRHSLNLDEFCSEQDYQNLANEKLSASVVAMILDNISRKM
jgi:hypothetical protein